MPPQTSTKRIDVAVGILISNIGEFLLTSRPVGKVMAGYWEFPGGKMKCGETTEETLRRELQEELGISIGKAHLWKKTAHDYPHALVRLHWHKVYHWQGDLVMREQQQYAWQRFPLSVYPVLPGVCPVLSTLEEQGV